MRPFESLSECISCIETVRAPTVWAASLNAIETEHNHLRALVEEPTLRVYGANTLVGHRDCETVSEPSAITAEILRTHAIGGAPWYERHTVKCIGYAKLYSWTAGLSGVSRQLFESVGDLLLDPNFNPRVPQAASYSCGDVIPAAHWANCVLEELAVRRSHTVRPGEIMALINGSFVHVGYAVSLTTKLERIWALSLEVALLFHSVTLANMSNLYFVSASERNWARQAVNYVREHSGRPIAAAAIQDPVSLRAIPQILEAWCSAIDGFLGETNYVLDKPSSNPFVDPKHPFPISQASFLSPTLSIKTSTLIEAVLFLMWALLGWVKHLLSGRIAGIPRDGGTAASPLGLIQYPKLMTAICADARLKLGRKTFASGSDTSYGIEDLWTNGVLGLAQLEEGLDKLQSMLCLAIWTLIRVVEDFDLEGRVTSNLLHAIAGCERRSDVSPRVSAYLDAGGLKELRQMFWTGG